MNFLLKKLLVAGISIPLLSINPVKKKNTTIVNASEAVPVKRNYFLTGSDYGSVLNKIENKKIPVLMFHKIMSNEDRYTISPRNFEIILDKLHKNNFYLINLEQFKKGDFRNIPSGKKPVLLTFDDAGKGQFEYINNSEIVNPNSAVGILQRYCTSNPDFGKGAVFYVSYSDDKHSFRTPFMQDNFFESKAKFLLREGYDIGWHTPFHSDNTHADTKEINEQSIILDALIYKSVGKENFDNIIKTYAHPFGAVPKSELTREYLLKQYDLVMNAWGGMSSHPLSTKFNPKEVPRIEVHTKNINKIVNSDTYQVSFEDSIYYDFMFNGIEAKFRGPAMNDNISVRKEFLQENNSKPSFY